MALHIKEEFGILKLLGDLDIDSASLIISHIKHLLDTKDSVSVSLEGLLSMDDYTAKSLEALYKDTAKKNKILSIYGMQNDNILDAFCTTETRYILSEDRI